MVERVGEYNYKKLPQVTEHMQKIGMWRGFFEQAGLKIDEPNVANLMRYIVDFRRPLIVTGCNIQCAFCDHNPPTDTSSAPWHNFTTVIDELNALKKIADIQYSYTMVDFTLHRNGETTAYASKDKQTGKIFNAYDALSYVAGEKNPLYRENSGRNFMHLYTAGWHGRVPEQAMHQIVNDANTVLGTDPETGYKGSVRMSFHMHAKAFKAQPEKWADIQVQNFATVRPLLEDDRLKVSVHYYKPGSAPTEAWRPFHLDDQLDHLDNVLKKAGYSTKERAYLFAQQSDNPYSALYVKEARIVPSNEGKFDAEIFKELEKDINIKKYGPYIKDTFIRPSEYFQVRGDPQVQLMIVCKNGGLFATPPHQERRGSTPDAELISLTGRLQLPIPDIKLGHYDILAEENDVEWKNTIEPVKPMSLHDLMRYMPREEYFARGPDRKNHDIDHLFRVVLYSNWLAAEAERIGRIMDKEALLYAAGCHDIRMVSSKVRPRHLHGKDAGDWVRENKSIFNYRVDVEKVAKLCEMHDDPPDKQPVKKSWELKILQDADALDRVRFNLLPGRENAQMNPLYLNTIFARRYLNQAKKLTGLTFNKPLETCIQLSKELGYLSEE